MEFKSIDYNFFKEIFRKYNINKSTIDDPKLPKRIKLDLTEYGYISFYDLVNFLLLVEYMQSHSEKLTIQFWGLDPRKNIQILNIDDYNNIKSKELRQDTKYHYSNKVYKLLAYLYYFGFFQAIEYARYAKKIIIPGVSDELLEKLYAYRNIGDCIFPIISIKNTFDGENFIKEDSINIWLKSLNDELIKHPIFRDGEFARVFGYQLTSNILEHSIGRKKLSHYDGAMEINGGICMQIIPYKKYKLFKNHYPTYFNNIATPDNLNILEIVVGDIGMGLYNSLKNTYEDINEKLGITVTDIPIKDVVKFAFDKIGSSKESHEKVGGVHALHRILRSVSKYGGIISIVTHGIELVYDLSSNNLKIATNGLGFEPNLFNVKDFPLCGTQYHILIPLNIKKFNTKPIPNKIFDYSTNNENISNKFSFVPVSSLKTAIKNKTFDEICKQKEVTNLTNKLHDEPQNVIIVYDFAGVNWTEEDIAKLLSSQKNILHTYFCVGINFPKGLPVILREREKIKIDEGKKKITKDTDFFDVLSSAHRLFPVFDTDNSITWLGLSEYDFDEILSIAFNNSDNILLEDQIFIKYDLQENKKGICKLYLNYNNQIFTPIKTDSGNAWKSKIIPELLSEIQKLSISKNISTHLSSLGCILEKKDMKYILPSSKNIYSKFIQTTPFFHNNPTATQIARWFANAIFSKLDKDEGEILLLTSTAPAELLSTIISDTLFPHKVYVINLGYYSSFDENIISSTKDWENIPVFIITDVINEGNSVREIFSKVTGINKNNDIKMDIRGLLALFQFKENLSEKINVSAKWEPSNIEKIDFEKFIFAYMKKPKSLEWSKENIDTEKLSVIEPFSLHDFSLKSLEYADNDNIEKFKLLSNQNLLREGHYVYENHHFSVTICLEKLFSDKVISNILNTEIIQIIRKNKINVILIPLHSHIKYFIPALLLNIKMRLGVNIEYYYCISTKALTDKPFYILPKELDMKLEKGAVSYNILILDDAIATGRTQETILRALFLASNKNPGQVIENLSIYTVINRLGRARNTFWKTIKELNYSNKGKSKQHINFDFNYWILFDMKVYQSDNCPLCKEKNNLIFLNQHFDNETKVSREIVKMIENIVAHSTESPAFIYSKKRYLSTSFVIGKLESDSVDMAIWQINNLVSRGYPFIYIINALDAFTCTIANKASPDDIYLIEEILKIIIENINKINSEYEIELLVKYFTKTINKGSTVVKYLLSFLGNKITEIKRNERKQKISNIVIKAVGRISNLKVKDVELENLQIGVALFLLFYRHNIDKNINIHEKGNDNDIYKGILDKVNVYTSNLDGYTGVEARFYIILYSLSKSSNANFITSLNLLLKHTIKAKRSQSHSIALPHKLYRLSRGHKHSEDEKKMLIDTLLYFVESFNVINKYYPPIFNNHYAQQSIVTLKKRTENLIEQLNISKVEKNKPPEEIISLAGKIYSKFPHNTANPIYTCLNNAIGNISTYINLIKAICEDKHYKFEVDGSISHNILLPTDNYDLGVIEDFFENYIKNPAPSLDNPKVKISITCDDGKLTMKVYTRIKSITSTRAEISHGTIDIIRSRNYLFEINAHFKKIDKDGFTAEITMIFLTSYQKDSKNEN